eukprot:1162049-Pelagomonas_calceolata.AAC.9
MPSHHQLTWEHVAPPLAVIRAIFSPCFLAVAVLVAAALHMLACNPRTAAHPIPGWRQENAAL